MKLFAEKGYENTSIEEITATVGVAKGTLYYHFASKEEIFNFLVYSTVRECRFTRTFSILKIFRTFIIAPLIEKGYRCLIIGP